MSEQHDDALSALGADITLSLASERPLSETLQNCAESLVRHLDVAFARVWTLNERNDVLVLQASAGRYTHLDGSHSRISVGAFKIGRIAQQRRAHLTNDVVNDPAIDREWASREGMVAFAGYPLLVGDQLVGVLGMFARHALSESVLDALEVVSRTIAIGIEQRGLDVAVAKQ